MVRGQIRRQTDPWINFLVVRRKGEQNIDGILGHNPISRKTVQSFQYSNWKFKPVHWPWSLWSVVEYTSEISFQDQMPRGDFESRHTPRRRRSGPGELLSWRQTVACLAYEIICVPDFSRGRNFSLKPDRIAIPRFTMVSTQCIHRQDERVPVRKTREKLIWGSGWSQLSRGSADGWHW